MRRVMRRPARIALGLLAPPAVGSVLLTVVMAAREGDAELLGALPIILAFAYVFAGIPAALFTLAMELAFWRGLDAGSWRAVRLASLLGLLSGCAMALLFSGGLRHAGESFALFPPVGLATGAIVGGVVRWRSRPPPTSSAPSPGLSPAGAGERGGSRGRAEPGGPEVG